MLTIRWMALAALAIALALPGGGWCSEDIQITTPGFPSRVSVDSEPKPQQVVVSVFDPEGEPIRGLQPHAFAMGRGIRKARILSAEPVQASQAVPLNLVLVIDNSFSMSERRAIQPLLTALGELLKDVRPIDNIHAVVFSDKTSKIVDGRALNVRTFQSAKASEWKAFFAEVFDRGITTKTYLYEAMAAGLDIVKKMPATEQKLMVVFSDGEDLNSKIGKGDVEGQALGIKKFQAYAIDYMPREQLDDFLRAFAKDQQGRIWKARSASELVPIFKDFKSTILHKYVLTYELLSPIALEPKTLNFELLTTTTGRPATHMMFFYTGKSDLPEKYVLFRDRQEVDAFRPAALSGSMSRYFNILNFVGKTLRDNPDARITLVGCHSNHAAEKDNLGLSQRRAETVKKYLDRIWGIDPDRMLVEARNLPEDPSPSDARPALLENQRVEFIVTPEAAQARATSGLIAEAQNLNAVTIKLDMHPLPGVTAGEIVIQDQDRSLKTVPLSAEIRPTYTISLDDLDRNRLSRQSSIEALIRVTDSKGKVHEAASDLCHIKLSQREMIHEMDHPPYGMLVLEPEAMTVEEITIVESSPLLNYVYFETGRVEIPERYVLFKSRDDALQFEEKALKGSIEKYHQVLNVIGRRAANRPRARLRIVGCNSGWGEEKGKPELSRARAEAVRSYLRSVWQIDPVRMDVESRALPEAASASNIPEGRLENQRVEIYSDDPAILDTVQSTFVEAVSDTDKLRISPQIESVLNLKRWTIEIYGDDKRLEALNGEGALEPSYILALKDVGLLNIGNYQNITAAIEAVDEKGQSFRTQDTSEVRFIKREERMSRREGYKVIERYALILFDFDRAEIKDRNRLVMDRISARIREIPSAVVKIVGHTDTIGKFDYNVSLSRKRAETAYGQLLASGTAARDRITFEGKGPADPLHDNALPEGRAFNRTVTVILEYEQQH